MDSLPPTTNLAVLPEFIQTHFTTRHSLLLPVSGSLNVSASPYIALEFLVLFIQT